MLDIGQLAKQLSGALNGHESEHCPICGAPNGETWPCHRDHCAGNNLLEALNMMGLAYTVCSREGIERPNLDLIPPTTTTTARGGSLRWTVFGNPEGGQ